MTFVQIASYIKSCQYANHSLGVRPQTEDEVIDANKSRKPMLHGFIPKSHLLANEVKSASPEGQSGHRV